MGLNLFLTVLVISSFSTVAQGADGSPWIPAPVDREGWMKGHNYFVQTSEKFNSTIKVIFYGDSLTHGWAAFGKEIFNKKYLPLGTVNWGIGGDKTEHVLWRIRNGEVTQNLDPKLCVLRIGANNIIKKDGPVSTALGVTFIIMELRERLPNMKILLLGCPAFANEQFTNKCKKVNEIIKLHDNGKTIRYLELMNEFYEGGENFKKELYVKDLVHLSEKGYEVWADTMDPLFKEMLES